MTAGGEEEEERGVDEGGLDLWLRYTSEALTAVATPRLMRGG